MLFLCNRYPYLRFRIKDSLILTKLEGLEEDIGINGEKLEDWRLMFQLLQGGQELELLPQLAVEQHCQ
ncbi:MAG: hypothetical protein V3S58_02055 [Nitrosomonadaceae bacterium]